VQSRNALNLISVLLSVTIASSTVAAELEVTGGGFGSPDATENTLAKDRAPREAIIDAEPLKAWKDWKVGLTENTGISFSVDYSAAWVTGDGFTRDDASGGMARFYGAWDLVNRGAKNSGAFVWKIEHRHGYTTPPPSGFASVNSATSACRYRHSAIRNSAQQTSTGANALTKDVQL